MSAGKPSGGKHPFSLAAQALLAMHGAGARAALYELKAPVRCPSKKRGYGHIQTRCAGVNTGADE